MKFGIERVAEHAVDYLLEYVTDLVFNDDGTVTGKGANARDVSTKAGYHFGFYSRPKDGAVGVIARFFGLSFLAAWRDKQFELSLQKGEVGLQNAFGANVLLDKNGVVNINGTAYSLIKTEDFLAGDGVAFLTSAVYGLWQAMGVIQKALNAPAANGVAPLLVADPTNALLTAFVTKLGAANFKSTKAKNG